MPKPSTTLVAARLPNELIDKVDKLINCICQSITHNKGRNPMNKYKQNLHVSGNKVYSYETHVATINGSTLEVLGYWSTTTSKHINYVAKEYGLTILEVKKNDQSDDKTEQDFINTVGLIAAIGNIFNETDKGRNDWKKRMLSAGLESKGLSFPEDWDQLTEEEKQRRLDCAINVL